MAKQFNLTVNGKTLAFSADQVPMIRSALDEAIKNPGQQATRSDDFADVRAFLHAPANGENPDHVTDC
jgi:hypothetical protein